VANRVHHRLICAVGDRVAEARLLAFKLIPELAIRTREVNGPCCGSGGSISEKTFGTILTKDTQFGPLKSGELRLIDVKGIRMATCSIFLSPNEKYISVTEPKKAQKCKEYRQSPIKLMLARLATDGIN
jgi:hypothetical protein